MGAIWNFPHGLHQPIDTIIDGFPTIAVVAGVLACYCAPSADCSAPNSEGCVTPVFDSWSGQDWQPIYPEPQSNWLPLTDSEALALCEEIYAWFQDPGAPVSGETGRTHSRWIDDLYRLSDTQVVANASLLLKILESEHPPCSDDGLRDLAAVLLGRDPTQKAYLLEKAYDWIGNSRLSPACTTGLVFLLTEDEFQGLVKAERDLADRIYQAAIDGVKRDAELDLANGFQNAVGFLAEAWALKGTYMVATDVRSKARILLDTAAYRSKSRYSSGASSDIVWARWELRALCDLAPTDVATAVLEARAEEKAALDASDARGARIIDARYNADLVPWLTPAVVDLVK